MLQISPSLIGPRLFFIWFYDKSITLKVLLILRPWESCLSSGSHSLQFDSFSISKEPADYGFARNLPMFERPCKLFPLKFNDTMELPNLLGIPWVVNFSNILSTDTCVSPHCLRLIFCNCAIWLIDSANPLIKSSFKFEYDRFIALKAFIVEKHEANAFTILAYWAGVWIIVHDLILRVWTCIADFFSPSKNIWGF